MENLFEEGADGPEKSEFQVIVVKVGKIEKHPGADTLSIVDVDGYPCIIKTGTFKEGDLAVYVPVDALVPVAREEFKFLAKLDRPDFTQHRVKAARLRGIFSMGLLVATSQKVGSSIEVQPGAYVTVKVGDNVQQLLGVEKWVAPEERKALAHEAQKRARVNKGPKLPVYGLDPLRRYGQSLPFGTQVVISEKLHGCNARFVFNNGRLWVGSHKAMRGCSRNRIGEFFERLKIKLWNFLGIGHRAHTLAELGDIWWQAAQEYTLKERLATKPNLTLYGEIYGEGVQFLTYDSPKGRKLRIFDIYDLEKKCFLDYTDFVNAAVDMGFDPVKDFVPYLYTGPWTEEVKDLYLKHANSGHSALNETQICEGVVIKPMVEMIDPRCGRVGLKYVGEGYLLSDDKKGNVGGKRAAYQKAKAAGFPNGDRVERLQHVDIDKMQAHLLKTVPGLIKDPETAALVAKADTLIAESEKIITDTKQSLAKSASLRERLAAYDAETKAAIAEGRLMRVTAPDGTGG